MPKHLNFHKSAARPHLGKKTVSSFAAKTASMRKLLLFTLLIIAGCDKKPVVAPDATASFERSINGSALWDWDFSYGAASRLNLTQTWYTGSATPGKQSRWTFSFVDPQTPVDLIFSFMGQDSSATLPMGKDMTFAYRSTQTDPDNITCSLAEKGSLYTGVDSTFMDINLQTMAKGLISGTFSMQLYSSTATVLITQGHFTNVPVTLATQ